MLSENVREKSAAAGRSVANRRRKRQKKKRNGEKWRRSEQSDYGENGGEMAAKTGVMASKREAKASKRKISRKSVNESGIMAQRLAAASAASKA
jgi:hypothetical protein